MRQRRLVLAAKLLSEDILVNDSDYDTVSEISSNLSDMSSYAMRYALDSYHTSKHFCLYSDFAPLLLGASCIILHDVLCVFCSLIIFFYSLQ